ncbi:MAG: hypothetical protein SH818_05175 [Saprospiraceae bacterium]|nr:hypothetical protein [Saprospiraceae bacterium]
MKTKSKPKRTFDAVKSMRKIRDKISLEIEHLNPEQLKDYFKQHRLKKKDEALNKLKGKKN